MVIKKTFPWFFLILFSSFSPLQADQYEPRTASSIYGFAPDPVIYTGMWTLHFKHGNRCNWKNQALGMEVNGVFISTMINTYFQRCYTAGISRHWYEKKISENTTIAFGYRLGGIYGYNHELKSIADIAEKYKVLPYGQLYSHLIYRRVRLELSYINKLFSLHLAVLINTF